MIINGRDVLEFLLPQGGWVINGDTFEGIEFIECEPITKAEFESGFETYNSLKVAQETQRAAEKQELLSKLGITEEEAKLLLS